jgi:probable F420-dependent oxidoreductase
MKVETGVMAARLDDVPPAARRAEDLGYDGFIVPQTSHDPFLPLALAAEHTERVELATAVAIAFPRSPMVTAHEAWDLQAFSKGRLLLGLGTQVKGHIERRFSMPWAAPGPRMREYILSLRAIWDCWQNGSKLDFRGEHYTFTLMTPFFNPGPIEHPHIAVYISAVNPYMCRLAGELCDGIRVHPFTTPRYFEDVIMPNVEAGAKKAGRSPADIDVCAGGFIIASDTEEEIERGKRDTRQQAAFYASTRTYKPVLDAHGWGDTALKLHRMSARGQWVEMADEITDEMLDQLAVIGTYDEIADKIKERWGGVVSRIAFDMPVRSPADEERLRAIVRALQD